MYKETFRISKQTVFSEFKQIVSQHYGIDDYRAFNFFDENGDLVQDMTEKVFESIANIFTKERDVDIKEFMQTKEQKLSSAGRHAILYFAVDVNTDKHKRKFSRKFNNHI